MKDDKPVVVNLGCGNRKLPGQIGLDRYPAAMADLLAELSEGLPLASGSVDEIVAEHVMEHVPDLVRLMEEIHRVLAPGGLLRVEVPYFAHPDAFRDPTHVRFFTWGSLDYFIDGMKPADYTGVKFIYRRRKLGFGNGLRAVAGRLISGLSVRRYEKYWARIFPARVLCAELVRQV
ncbi:MAG: methyltransferase domain-containing protein [Candidatus Glassbacteria bacterium]|nr:methyltransferase domain-containing protein [Candidatus Glassbacteria bacterium]